MVCLHSFILLETKQNDDKEELTNLSPKELETKAEFDSFLENLKQLLGEYLAKRKESKFEIIENVMKMKVFENKEGEIKFLEDALGHTKVSSSLTVIQSYMKTTGMLLSQGKSFLFQF